MITAWLGEDSARPARQLFADARIATYESPDSAVSAFVNRVRHRDNQVLLMETPSARTDAFEADSASARRVIAAAIAAGKSWLDPKEIGVVFAAYGLGLSPAISPRIRQVPRRLLRALPSLSPSRSAARILGSNATSAA